MVLPFPSFFHINIHLTPITVHHTPSFAGHVIWQKLHYTIQRSERFLMNCVFDTIQKFQTLKRNRRRKIQGKYFTFFFCFWKKKQFVFFWNLTQYMDEFYRIKFCHRILVINLLRNEKKWYIVYLTSFIQLNFASYYIKIIKTFIQNNFSLLKKS